MNGPARDAVRRAFRRAAAGYAAGDFLHAEIRARLLERLEAVRLAPAMVVDLGAGPPEATGDVAARFATARVLAIDAVPEMLGAATQAWWRVTADAVRLPLPDASVDVVVASMLLPWCADPVAVLAETRRVLRYPGLFAFATLGPGSLRELREAWAAVDRHSHVLGFADMHDLGDALVAAGFAEPVLDTERLTVTYRDLRRLVIDLRAVGARDLSEGRRRSLTGPSRWSAMAEAYERLRTADGVLPLSVEAVFGHAWTGMARPGRDGTIEIPLQKLQRRG